MKLEHTVINAIKIEIKISSSYPYLVTKSQINAYDIGLLFRPLCIDKSMWLGRFGRTNFRNNP